MGTRASMNPTRQPRASALRSAGVDLPLLVTVILLCAFGLLVLYSASTDFSYFQYEKDTMYMFNRQLFWLGLGIIVAFTLSHLDYRHWRRLAVPALGGTVLLLITTLIVGKFRGTLFEASGQPSETAKLAIVIYLSVWLYSKKAIMNDMGYGLFPLSLILGLVGGLIILQPDISAGATIFILGGLLFFLGGGDYKQISIMLIIAAISAWIIIQINPFDFSQINDFKGGIENPSYHVSAIWDAINAGGFFGVGPGNGTIKLLNIPHIATDSIFAVIAEEFGLLGIIGLMGFYALLAWRGLVIAKRVPDMLGSLLATGLTFWLITDAAINILVMVGLLPFAGNTLPFISYGGSSLIMSLAAVGILLNISRHAGTQTKEETTTEWRNLNATIDLRGRNGRRSLSGSGRRSDSAR